MDMDTLFLQENVGGWDLFLRSAFGAAGIVALSMGLIKFPEPWNQVFGLAVFVGLFSGMTRHCTPYGVLGVSTAKKKQAGF
jgi:hypothetical protein